jgi:hypothetical protein
MYIFPEAGEDDWPPELRRQPTEAVSVGFARAGLVAGK